jgi:hypothetical protein
VSSYPGRCPGLAYFGPGGARSRCQIRVVAFRPQRGSVFRACGSARGTDARTGLPARQTTKQNVTLRLKNFGEDKEFAERSVVKESLTTADGKNYQTKFYNLRIETDVESLEGAIIDLLKEVTA